jgi:hypothetical protein
VWAVAPAVFTVFVIWYQFGFTLGGMLEEWDVLYLMKINPGFWNTFPGNPMSHVFAARPLQILPHFIASTISADSFEGFHLVMMTAVLMRVIGAASVGYYLFRNRTYAAAFGILSFVFPADTQQFEFRTFHISIAVGLMVWAAACTVRSFQTNKSMDRWLSICAATILACIGVLIYEPVLTLYLIAPIAILAREGLRDFISLVRSRGTLVAAWLIGPLINTAYLYYAIAIYQSSYQIDASGNGMGRSIVHNFHYLIDSAAYRVFYDAWISTFEIFGQIIHFKFLLFVTALLAASLLLLTKHWKEDVSTSRTIRYVMAGLILAIAAYMPFMVAESHMRITQRTFIAVAPGASLIVVALVARVCRRQTAIGAIVVTLFLMCGFVAQLYQFDFYTRNYVGVVRPYISMVADQIDKSKSVHLVFDRSGFGAHLDGIYFTKISYAPTVRLGKYPGASVLCMDGKSTDLAPFATCTLSNGIWTVRDFGRDPVSYPSSNVQVITIGADFDSNYRSYLPTWRDQESFEASKSIFRNEDFRSYHCTADSMWGYSEYCRGEGWTDGIFNHDHFAHQNWFEAYRIEPTLILQLMPIDKPYELKVVLFQPMEGLSGTIRVMVNGAAIPMNKTGSLTYTGVVRPSDLKPGQNIIAFDNALPKGQVAGLSLVSVTLSPR